MEYFSSLKLVLEDVNFIIFIEFKSFNLNLTIVQFPLMPWIGVNIIRP